MRMNAARCSTLTLHSSSQRRGRQPAPLGRPITDGAVPPNQPANSRTTPSPSCAVHCALRRGTASSAAAPGRLHNGTLLKQASCWSSLLRNASDHRCPALDAFAGTPRWALQCGARQPWQFPHPPAHRRPSPPCLRETPHLVSVSGRRNCHAHDDAQALLGPLQLRVPASHELRLLQQPVIELGGEIAFPDRIPGSPYMQCTPTAAAPAKTCGHCSAPSRTPTLWPVLEHYARGSCAKMRCSANR
jgi:hypothetical protein